MPKNAKKGVYKEKEFETYMLWKSLPAHFKGIKKKELESSGFTDPIIYKIIKIKNQTEFAKYFHIKDLGTLTDWNNKIKKENIASPPLTTNFQKQSSIINEKIILPSIEELENKIHMQNKIVFLLKKKNASLKKKANLRTFKKSKRILNSTTATPQEIAAPVKLEINSPKYKTSKTIFQKIRDVFLK